MSPQGRPKGEYRNAQHGGCLMRRGSWLILACVWLVAGVGRGLA